MNESAMSGSANLTEPARAPAVGGQQRRFWWARLLAGPLLYTVYFLLTYLAVEGACTLGWLAFDVGGTNGITVTVLVLTALALLAVLLSLLLGLLRLRRLPRTAENTDPATGDADRFVARMGVMLDLLFVFLVLATGAPALLLAPCAWS